jgi:hypothetical protein
MKLDLGCGPNKREGFTGVDRIAFPGVDHVVDIGVDAWPFVDGSVEEAYSSHFVEHLTAVERIHFVNELYRVLQPGASCQIIVPHWASHRAYGDPTHQWPPIGEMWFFYLDKDWRASNAPHTDKANWQYGYDCNFTATWGYALNPALGVRSQEYQQFAVENYKEAVFDIHATLTKK